MLGWKHSFRSRGVRPTPYRVQVIDNNIVEEVPCIGWMRRRTGVSLGTHGRATTARNLDTSKSTVAPSNRRTRKHRNAIRGEPHWCSELLRFIFYKHANYGHGEHDPSRSSAYDKGSHQVAHDKVSAMRQGCGKFFKRYASNLPRPYYILIPNVWLKENLEPITSFDIMKWSNHLVKHTIV
jgi:hypothetical protein